jgi:hypothetical protein
VPDRGAVSRCCSGDRVPVITPTTTALPMRA